MALSLEQRELLYRESSKRHFSKDPQAVDFVNRYLREAQATQSNAAILEIAINATSIEGMHLEVGVYMGKTLNYLASLKPDYLFHGFDSFEGLPEDWDRGDKHSLDKGMFSLEDKTKLPKMLANVQLHAGWFKDSLPKFKKETLKDQPISFLHIDCDLYSSTKDVFEYFGENIQTETVILFDELYNYPSYKEHEFKALQEFLAEKKLSIEYIAYNENSEQVAGIIKKSS